MDNLVTSRIDNQNKFLQDNNFDINILSPIKGDASRRNFARIVKNNKSYIFIDANPELGEEPVAYEAITTILRDNNINAPEIIASDLKQGFFIVHDFGDNLFSYLLNTDRSKEELFYKTAIDNLVQIKKISYNNRIILDKASYSIYDYDITRLLNEAKLFTQWYAPAILKRPLPSIAQDEFNAIITGMILPTTNSNKVLVLRDYHVANLMWQDSYNDHKRSGVIDFQDALWGNPAYDLASLLQDARRDVSPEFAEKILEYYHKIANPPADFMRDYEILGLQRNLKILGIFIRLNIRDKKPVYLEYIPLVWRYINDVIDSERFKPFKAWLDRWLPEQIRYLYE